MSTSASSMPQPAPFLAVPRDRGDEACEQLSPVAFKVWYRITRLTVGWNKDEALISYNDFKRACGIKDRHTISNAIKELVAKGFARVVQNIEATGRKLTSLYSLINVPSGKNPLPITQISPSTQRVVEKIHQVRVMKSTTPSGKNPLPTPRQPAPAAAPQEAIETLIETSIDNKTYIAAKRETVELASIAPSARASEEARIKEDVLALSEEEIDEETLEPAEERARLENYLERLKAIDPQRLSRIDQITLRNRIRRTERHLDDLNTLSDSPAQADAPPPPSPLIEQASVITEPQRAWLPENETTIETRTPDAPAVLFEEALPPEPVERPFAVVARLFFMEDVKITQADAKEIQSVVNVLHEHGVDDPWRIEELYMFWRDRYRALKQKTMYHFKGHAFQTAQGGA